MFKPLVVNLLNPNNLLAVGFPAAFLFPYLWFTVYHTIAKFLKIILIKFFISKMHMEYYIALDGGGTKLKGMLFNGLGQVIASGEAGGVNPTVYTREEIHSHAETCIAQLLTKEIPSEIESCIVTQNNEEYRGVIESFVPCGTILESGEGVAGLLACGIKNGICALSGTGSDVFLIEKNLKVSNVFGGWGNLLDDDGSGVWIGKQAARSYLLMQEEREARCLMHNLLEQKYGFSNRLELMSLIYDAKAPIPLLGSFCKSVAQAAQYGDLTAQAILREAGVQLAAYALDLIRLYNQESTLQVATTGSVFQHCVHMREAFCESIREVYPNTQFYTPLFEPVVGAMIYGLLQKGLSLSEELITYLEETCSEFRITSL